MIEIPREVLEKLEFEEVKFGLFRKKITVEMWLWHDFRKGNRKSWIYDWAGNSLPHEKLTDFKEYNLVKFAEQEQQKQLEKDAEAFK